MSLFVHSYLFKSRQASSPSMFRFKVASLHSGSIDSLQMSSQNQNEPNRSSLLFLLYLFWPERAFLIGYLPSLTSQENIALHHCLFMSFLCMCCFVLDLLDVPVIFLFPCYISPTCIVFGSERLNLCERSRTIFV